MHVEKFTLSMRNGNYFLTVTSVIFNQFVKSRVKKRLYNCAGFFCNIGNTYRSEQLDFLVSG